jgi:hypothetical protein
LILRNGEGAEWTEQDDGFESCGYIGAWFYADHHVRVPITTPLRRTNEKRDGRADSNNTGTHIDVMCIGDRINFAKGSFEKGSRSGKAPNWIGSPEYAQ